MKNVLIIGNNPMSYTQPNAKTVLSLLDDDSEYNLYQVYFRDDLPTFERCQYYRVTDKDVLRSIYTLKKAGREVSPKAKADTYSSAMQPVSSGKYLIRFAREIMWMVGHIDWDGLYKWVNSLSIDIVFCVGGDCVFAYKILERIIKNCSLKKLVLFITDDYILPRKTKNPFFWVRRNMLLTHMKKDIARSNLFLVISEEMKNQYYNLFKKDAQVFANIPDGLSVMHNQRITNNGELVFLYAGGLHYNRWKTLGKLSQAIEEYNVNSIAGPKAVLKIYSQQVLSSGEMSYLCGAKSTEFLGEVDSTKMMDVLQDADVLVHVESFDIECIEATRLSFSTKIYEYTSQNKSILAIGPNEIGSMKFLCKCAMYIDSEDKINSSIIERLMDSNLRKDIASKCYEEYKKAISDTCCKSELRKMIVRL